MNSDTLIIPRDKPSVLYTSNYMFGGRKIKEMI